MPQGSVSCAMFNQRSYGAASQLKPHNLTARPSVSKAVELGPGTWACCDALGTRGESKAVCGTLIRSLELYVLGPLRPASSKIRANLATQVQAESAPICAARDPVLRTGRTTRCTMAAGPPMPRPRSGHAGIGLLGPSKAPAAAQATALDAKSLLRASLRL